MALHRTDSTRIESVRVATRLRLARKDQPAPTLAEILADAAELDVYYRSGKTLDQLADERIRARMEGPEPVPAVVQAVRRPA